MPVLAVVGGGVSVASLAEALAGRSDLPDRFELRIIGQDPGRARTIGRHVAALIGRRRPTWAVRATTDLADGVRDADAVVLAVRIGGSAARHHDEELPRRFGRVGDEGLGLGGLANAWRTVPHLIPMARTIADVAPDALVWNLVAPLGVTTRVLHEQGLRVWGLCELPQVTARRLAAAVPSSDRPLHVGGLNHLSWCWTDLGPDDTLLRDVAVEARMVHPADWRRFGAVPLPYRYRVVRPELGEALGIVQPRGRARQLDTLSSQVLAAMADRPGQDLDALRSRATPWWDVAVAPAIAATIGGREHDGWSNVVNEHRFPGLPASVVVEVPTTFGVDGVRPATLPEPPPAAAELLVEWAELDRLAHRAAVTRDVDALRDAVAALPSEVALSGPADVELATREICRDPRDLDPHLEVPA